MKKAAFCILSVFVILLEIWAIMVSRRLVRIEQQFVAIESQIEALQHVCTNMREVDTLILHMCEHNDKEIGAINNHFISLDKEMERLEIKVKNIDEELDSYD